MELIRTPQAELADLIEQAVEHPDTGAPLPAPI